MVADVCRLMISEYQALTPTSVVYYLASVSITCTMKTHAGYYAIVSENMNPIMANLSDSEQYMSRIKWCIRFFVKNLLNYTNCNQSQVELIKMKSTSVIFI